jgi:hypothetical protein
MQRTILLALVLVTVSVPGQAIHADDTFQAGGHVTAANPTSDGVGGVSENEWILTGEETLEGVDGDVVELPPWAPGHTVWVNGTSEVPHDLDVWFYDEDRTRIGAGQDEPDGDDCVTAAGDEVCRAPEGARYAAVDQWAGAETDFTLQVVSVEAEPEDPDGGEDVLAIPQGLATWNHTDLDVVILPPATGPVYDRKLEPFPDGGGLATDSPYVDATRDAIEAWEQAIDAYVARNASAAYLQAFDFEVSVVGEDASLADFESADVRVAYAPTMLFVLGVTAATPEDGQQWDQCDIVDSQWLEYSFTVNDMYNVHSHEFGHCLGLSHPDEPGDDLMQGGYSAGIGDPGNDRLCHSSLDVQGLAGLYAWLAEGDEWQAPPDEVELPTEAYETYEASLAGADQDGCPNPGSNY